MSAAHSIRRADAGPGPLLFHGEQPSLSRIRQHGQRQGEETRCTIAAMLPDRDQVLAGADALLPVSGLRTLFSPEFSYITPHPRRKP
jgi:hypothetical protein